MIGRRAAERLARALAPRRRDIPLWNFGLGRDAQGRLQLDRVDLGGLLERWSSPLFVVDAARLAGNARRFTASEGVETYASYKTNPVPGVLTRLHARDVGAEVVSAYELWLALRLGVPPERIIFNGPARSPAAFALAIRRELELINLNGLDELAQVAALARGLGKRPRIGLRVVPASTLGGQFGESIATGAAVRAVRAALENRSVELVAIHAHPNGRLGTHAELDTYLRQVLAFTDALDDALEFHPQVLDLGGNLASPTVAPYSPLQQRLAQTLGIEPVAPAAALGIDAYVQHVAWTVHGHFEQRGHRPPRVFVEPGRALMSDAQLLLMRVAELRGPDASGLTWAVLDGGINIAESVRHEFHQLFPVHLRRGAPERLYRITGPSCTLGDQLYAAWRLPELRVGDALAIMDAGAYLVPYSTCFSQPRPGIAIVEGGRAELLRRPETFEELIARDLDLPRPAALAPRPRANAMA